MNAILLFCARNYKKTFAKFWAKGKDMIYLVSERTFVDAQASIAAYPYLNSERTSVPVNFTKYQRSEWFGK